MNRLKNYVLARADQDPSLSEQVRLAAVAAVESPEDLADVLEGVGASPDLRTNLAESEALRYRSAPTLSQTVQGFRGIGPKVTVPPQPGSGLGCYGRRVDQPARPRRASSTRGSTKACLTSKRRSTPPASP